MPDVHQAPLLLVLASAGKPETAFALQFQELVFTCVRVGELALK